MRKLFVVIAALFLQASLHAAVITVQAPIGGEMYFEGLKVVVQTKTGLVSEKVELSRDNGITWTTLGTINNRAKIRLDRNRLVWSVDGPASPQCLLRFSGKRGKKVYTVVSNQFAVMTRTYFSGDTGPVGIQGLKGDTGDVGVQGLKGDTGDRGPQGVQGIPGVKGDTGLQGDIGSTGPEGPTGPQGTAGADGAQGPVGPVGPAGQQGVAGNDGAQGLQGVAGNDGATGPVGPVGPTGPQGAQGSQGPTGPNGAPTVSYINTASAVNAQLDGSRHSGTLVINDPNIRGPNNPGGRSQIFFSFSTASAVVGTVSISGSGLSDGHVTVNISTQNYALQPTDTIDYQIVNAQ